MQFLEFDGVKFLAFRYVTGFLALLFIWLAGFMKLNYKGKPVYLLLLCGVMNPLSSQTLETMAIAYEPTSELGVFLSLVPVLVVLFSIPINRELPTKRQVFFMLVSVFGIMIINLIDGHMIGGTSFGIFLMLSAIVIISVQRVLIRRASGYFTAFETIFITTGMGAVGFTIWTLSLHAVKGQIAGFFDGLWTVDFLIPVLYMGVLSAVVGFLCLTYAAGHLPIAVSSSTSMLNSVISVLVGIFILNEVFRPVDIIGTAITFLGILGMSLSYNANLSNRFGKIKSNE